MKSIWISALIAFAIPGKWAAADQAVPPFPQYYVFDESQLLIESQRKSLETLLIEHDQSAGEQVLVAVFKGLDGADPIQKTHAVFEEWLTNRGQAKSALLAVYAKEQTGIIESGYGLQSLEPTTARALIHDILEPELKQKHPFRAVGLSVLELMRAIQSPLIESGRAEQLLQQGGLEGRLSASRPNRGPASWFAFVWVGTLLFAGVLIHVFAAEAHFTAHGWFKPNPLKRFSPSGLRRGSPRLKTSGGIDGRW